MNNGKLKIDFITLGCSKNLVDTERLMRQLERIGFDCEHDSPKPKGQIAVINTCGFIGDAKEESINTILQFAARKKKGKLLKLYVMGCLAERYMHELEAELPEVDKFYGKFNFLELIDDLTELQHTDFVSIERHLTTPKHYAYLKIAEGCNRFCSYCAIPLITGKYQSRPMEEILDEVRWLVEQGVKELQVIAQDLTYYGTDLYGKPSIAELVDQIAAVQGIEWIRLHYAYPTHFPLDLLPVMRKHPNVCKYLDIALQHSSDNMLSLMHRHITAKEQTELIATIRREVPGIHIRTTFMVGHPGETEADFAELMSFVKEQKFERMGAFAYSDEEGTYANRFYKDDVPQEVKQKRLDQLMQLQEEIAAQVSEQKVGQILKVIIDRIEADYYIGRTEFDSPEVDCEVLIKRSPLEKELLIGEFCMAKILSADTFDLYAELVSQTTNY